MQLRQWVRSHFLDWAMRQLNELRPLALAGARGEVLEVGFGSGLNLAFYPPEVTGLVGVEPYPVAGLRALDARLRAARFPVEQHALRADGRLPFASGRFDCVVTTWTLCSIPDPAEALREMRRVLKPAGRYLFIEHGRAPGEGLARWQDRLNPAWRRFSGGCNLNRPIDRIVEQAGFDSVRLERFRHSGPALLSHMYRGAVRAA